jgi:hypothetical protein
MPPNGVSLRGGDATGAMARSFVVTAVALGGFAASGGGGTGALATGVLVALAPTAGASCRDVLCSTAVFPPVASTMIVDVQCRHFSETLRPAIRRAKMSSDIDISVRHRWHLTRCGIRVLP